MALPELITGIPGPRSRSLAAKLRRFESRNVTFVADGWPVFWQRAAGVNVWDADGNRFLDLTSAFGVSGLGHGAMGAAMAEQSQRLLHAMGDVHPTELKAELCARLSAITFERWGVGVGKTILGNSGFEAIEAALKTSLLRTGRRGVLAFRGGYHGLGFGALTTTGLPFFREPFRAQLPDFATFVPFPCEREQIEAALREREFGCILVEPIQGRGGCVVPPPDFLPMLRAVCDAHGILLVLDEIYTGFNRTGALFACEHSGVVPDIVCLGKALTGGFPLSACVGRAEVMDAWPESRGEALHTSTFLGNPVGCAMALASIVEHAKPETPREVRERGANFEAALRRLGDVRGMGLLLGMEVTPARAQAVVQRALSEGVLLLADGPGGNVLSFTPPFAISEAEIAFVSERLAQWLR
ncbi:MAG: aspartate aminotransferase family protein [Chthoniobacteraceae bacterium]